MNIFCAVAFLYDCLFGVCRCYAGDLGLSLTSCLVGVGFCYPIGSWWFWVGAGFFYCAL